MVAVPRIAEAASGRCVCTVSSQLTNWARRRRTVAQDWLPARVELGWKGVDLSDGAVELRPERAAPLPDSRPSTPSG